MLLIGGNRSDVIKTFELGISETSERIVCIPLQLFWLLNGSVVGEAAKPEDLRSISGFHKVEGEKKLL